MTGFCSALFNTESKTGVEGREAHRLNVLQPCALRQMLIKTTHKPKDHFFTVVGIVEATNKGLIVEI